MWNVLSTKFILILDRIDFSLFLNLLVKVEGPTVSEVSVVTGDS